ncbi:ParE-like toxin of type II ParDE toxin-antitoxin system [Loktanella sp. PT4BL]|jgi:plasmid stabilization system protein ParE|uniref:type II toxin-antitoxin system RelE/ParE family toxin n=1 Tax=Loktanella sp. PT4BL TaxID=2135611 RepID=UPI000D775260|nr:type II toxin-antitoxin system RelE/ParE family toxin [Loktanella sp. PT4BL]PXW67353.1 ParE-like toxin of type II ParDE toxin-antitoxin system [Loktanella sp. PT4BL]
MKVVFLESTVQDLKWFRHYYRAVFSEGADKAGVHFKAAIATLEANPFAGRRGEPQTEIRELSIPRTPFTIVYRVTPLQIEVLRLWDTRQGGDY